MTRVNLIDPDYLIDEHLVAEYREIKRIVNNPPKGDNIPKSYVLGSGHVTFFKDKLDYIRYRHARIVNEMKQRGFVVNIQLSPPTSNNFWRPSQQEVMISATRLIDRITDMNKEPHYYKEQISRERAIELVIEAT
jgi:deoxyribonuclease (pyrimidine dimer)